VSAVVDLDLRVPLERFTLEARWTSDATALGVFGPSGAGKTTLLEALAGLRPRATGRVVVRGRTWLDTARGICLSPERRGVGYVPQDALLFPHRDVRGNLLSGLRRARRSRARALTPGRVIELLELGDLLPQDPRSLSGGERQRVALGRALCSGPELLLMDEPLAGLDLALRRRILPYLLRVREEVALPTLYVSHDAGEVQMLCDEAIVLARGAVVARGRPAEVLSDPGVLPTGPAAGFENVLHGCVVAREEETATVTLDGGGPALVVPAAGVEPGSRAAFGLRAEDVLLAAARPARLSARNVVAGRVEAVRRGAGGEAGALRVDVALHPSGTRVAATVTEGAARELGLEPGREVHLVFKTQACRLLASLLEPTARDR
jgi:molybdate transport system ATP-binding protein